MSYIWEDKNRGKSLYEMAIIKQNSLMEAATNFPFNITEEGKQRIDELKAAGQVNNAGNVIFSYDPQDPQNAKAITKKIKGFMDAGLISKGNSGDNGQDKGSNAPKALPMKIIDPTQKGRIEQILTKNNVKFEIKQDSQDGPIIVNVANAGDEKVQTLLKEMQAKNMLADGREQSEIDGEVHNKREAGIAKIISQFPEDVRLKVSLGCYNLADGKWFDGTVIEPGSRQEAIAQKFIKAISTGNLEQAKTALQTIESAISDGRIKVNPSNAGLYSIPNIEKQVSGNIRMPAMFDAEPDDTMWNEIVISDFGIPMINLSHPAVKKVISSDDPEHECPGDLKIVKKKIYGDPRLQKVFGKGGLERMMGKAFNLLTLGVAAATTDAGKRADRIVKELKEKGGMTTHRNLLLVKYDDIVDADPENPDSRITAKAYNRGTKKFVGEIDIPVTMLGQFYSAVDPIKSSKIYIEMYNNKDCGDYGIDLSGVETPSKEEPGKNTTDALEAVNVLDEEPLYEYCGANQAATAQKPLYEYILCTALAVAAAAAVPQVANLVHGISGSKRQNGVNAPDASRGNGEEFEKLKKQFVEQLDREGHPPSYVLKPKSANKEVVIVSKASTGHMQGGKVLMVTLKIGDHEAASFMTPKECKEYFSV